MNNTNKFYKTFGPIELKLDGGHLLKSTSIAYNTWGKLNAKKSNAILICHALTGDQFVTGKNPITNRKGWWENIVGPNKILDTNKYFIICTNVLGGCMGTTGPSSVNLDTSRPYGMEFPIFTIKDMVNLQLKLIESLNIDKLFSIIGGSMGGMQVLEWAASYPDKLYSAIPIATSYRHSAQNIAFHEVGRQAIMNDPDWNNGNYYNNGNKPRHGLSVARMIAHITYLSESALQRKFGRNLQNSRFFSFEFETEFQIESYLKHQGISFVERFDANSYLYITKAMDYFDLSVKKGGLRKAFSDKNLSYCFITFSSDWLFPTSETKTIIQSINQYNTKVSFAEIKTDKGHDAFLLHEPNFHSTLKSFITGQKKRFKI